MIVQARLEWSYRSQGDRVWKVGSEGLVRLQSRERGRLIRPLSWLESIGR